MPGTRSGENSQHIASSRGLSQELPQLGANENSSASEVSSSASPPTRETPCAHMKNTPRRRLHAAARQAESSPNVHVHVQMARGDKLCVSSRGPIRFVHCRAMAARSSSSRCAANFHCTCGARGRDLTGHWLLVVVDPSSRASKKKVYGSHS